MSIINKCTITRIKLCKVKEKSFKMYYLGNADSEHVMALYFTF